MFHRHTVHKLAYQLISSALRIEVTESQTNLYCSLAKMAALKTTDQCFNQSKSTTYNHSGHWHEQTGHHI